MNENAVFFQIDAEHEGLRLDRFEFPGSTKLSRTRIQSLIHSGDITVNGKCIKPSYALRASDIVTCNIPDPVPVQIIAQNLNVPILYEDSDIVVVDKPRGMAVHPGAGINDRTLVNALLHLCDDLSGIGGVIRPGIVHRLDKGTSGVMIAAKNDHAHCSLAGQFAARTMEKEYLALAAGMPQWRDITVKEPIGRHPNHRVKMTVIPTGKAAATRFHLEGYGETGFLVSAHPSSGRTHQIRVHLEYLNHPVLGDPVYGSTIRRQIPGIVQKYLKEMPGFCLHAARLAFFHPSDGRRMEVSANLPADFLLVMSALGIAKFDRETDGISDGS